MHETIIFLTQRQIKMKKILINHCTTSLPFTDISFGGILEELGKSNHWYHISCRPQTQAANLKLKEFPDTNLFLIPSSIQLENRQFHCISTVDNTVSKTVWLQHGYSWDPLCKATTQIPIGHRKSAVGAEIKVETSVGRFSYSHI